MPDGSAPDVIPAPSTTSSRLAATSGQSRGRFRETVFNAPDAKQSGYVMPPDVTEAEIDGFFKEAAVVTGGEHVHINISVSEQAPADYVKQPAFYDFFAVDEKDKHMASAAICPSSTHEVIKLVELANKYRVPISPVSIGRNLGYGGTAPRLRGAVILDLKRMNKILEVDEEQAFIRVEPGCSYFQVYEHLRSIGSKLWLDVPDIGWGSMLGNAVERGAGYTPMGDHFMFHCGMEVVLPTGKLVRTGMGAMENSNTWQLFQYGFGPYHDGIFTQGNFGIVTAMGFWLMPDPGGYKPFLITVPREEDVVELVDRIRPLRLSQIIQNAPTIRHTLLDAACIKPKAEWNPEDPNAVLSEEKILKIADEMKIGRWSFYGALYGPPPITDVLWGAIWGSLSQIKGAKHYFEEDVGPESILHSRAQTLKGIPNLLELDWISWLPNGAHAFFSPISPVKGEDAWKQVQFVKKKSEAYGFDSFLTLIIGYKEMHNICCLVFDKEDPVQRDKMRNLIRELIDDGAALGYGEYRTHIDFMDQIAGTYNFNNGAIADLNNTLKDALDPNGILAPGKQGIWPKRYRGKGY